MALEPIIRDRILTDVISPLRYEELGTPTFLDKLKANIKRIINEVLKNSGSKQIPEEPVLKVLITDWRY